MKALDKMMAWKITIKLCPEGSNKYLMITN